MSNWMNSGAITKLWCTGGGRVDLGGKIKGSVFDKLSVRCLWDIQVEISNRTLDMWLWNSGEVSVLKYIFGSYWQYKLFETIIVGILCFSFKCQADLVLVYLASLLNTQALWLFLYLLVSYLNHPISGSLCRFLYNYIVKSEHCNRRK